MENITGVLVDAPLAWHKLGLRETASGYGKKLTTRYKIAHKERLYRVYVCVFGNAGSSFIIARGEKIFLSDTVAYPSSSLPHGAKADLNTNNKLKTHENTIHR